MRDRKIERRIKHTIIASGKNRIGAYRQAIEEIKNSDAYQGGHISKYLRKSYFTVIGSNKWEFKITETIMAGNGGKKAGNNSECIEEIPATGTDG